MEPTNIVPSAAEVQPVAAAPEQAPAAPAGGEPTVEQLKQQLELEQAKRIIAESDATNAKKDIIAIKTGRKREEVDLAQLTQQQPPAQPITPTAAPTAVPSPTEAALAAALAEQQRITNELLRSARPGFAPTGGGGFAPTPEPKPQGYWSEAQRGELKKRGWSDDKIARAEKMAQNRAGLSETTPEAYGHNVQRRY